MAARIGPNPYITEIARHIPRIGGWAVTTVVFFGWPFVFKASSEKGLWKP